MEVIRSVLRPILGNDEFVSDGASGQLAGRTQRLLQELGYKRIARGLDPLVSTQLASQAKVAPQS